MVNQSKNGDTTDGGEIFKSFIACDPSKFPKTSFPEYIFQLLGKQLHAVAEKPWLVDVCTDKKVLFGEVEQLARKVASGLARRGFTKGDILYFVCYDIVSIGVLQLAVWLLGGVTRGCCQIEQPEEYRRQMNDIHCKFVAVDADTVQAIRKAISLTDMDCTIINVGDSDIEETTKFSDLAGDDGTAFPDSVKIDPNDILLICNTSGSTGAQKGVIHSHETFVNLIASLEPLLLAEGPDVSKMTTASNYVISYLWTTALHLGTGNTVHCVSKYKKEELIPQLLKYKPQQVFLYPYITNGFARSTELDKHDFSFLKAISLGGSIVDPTTVHLLQRKFPHTRVNVTFASTECMGISMTVNSATNQLSLFGTTPDGEEIVSCGVLFPLVEAKIVDVETNKLLGRNKLGRLFIRGRNIMKGYLVEKGKEPNRSSIDEEGWFDTGDLVFMDSKGQLFVRERVSFMFKYYMHYVNPTEIEAVLQKHPAVQMACVIGVPDKETTNLAKALVVLKDGETACTEEELLQWVANKLTLYKHLHGGLHFVDSLPENKGGKLDRAAAKKKYSQTY
ncbi:uncharacterized protein LOC135940708 [Cloeon dipterum]|uniref:uncharacterized protein LOC135940708 n=1 Tax=Cloeon dipterum TaxID=197152 RepID=UPI00321FE431